MILLTHDKSLFDQIPRFRQLLTNQIVQSDLNISVSIFSHLMINMNILTRMMLMKIVGPSLLTQNFQGLVGQIYFPRFFWKN